MTIYEAVHALVGFPHLCAFRRPRPVIGLTTHNMMVDYSGPKPRRYQPSFADIVHIDWQVMEKTKYGQMMAQMAAEAQAQLDQVQGEVQPPQGESE